MRSRREPRRRHRHTRRKTPASDTNAAMWEQKMVDFRGNEAITDINVDSYHGQFEIESGFLFQTAQLPFVVLKQIHIFVLGRSM